MISPDGYSLKMMLSWEGWWVGFTSPVVEIQEKYSLSTFKFKYSLSTFEIESVEFEAQELNYTMQSNRIG